MFKFQAFDKNKKKNEFLIKVNMIYSICFAF